MKKRIINLLTILIVLIGAVVLLYPMVSNMLYQRSQKERAEYYDNMVQELPEEETDSMWELCWEYNESLLDLKVQITDPFDEQEYDLAEHPYVDLLNAAGDGVMGYIEIPAINCLLPIYHGADAESLSKGVGHLQGTSLPVGGTGSHAVLSAHTGTPNRELFTNLDQLETGDVFYLHILDEILAYQVDQILVVLPDETDSLVIDRDEDYVTLVTCTPYGVNSHRLLVRGARVAYEAAKAAEAEQGPAGSTWVRQYLLAILVGIGLVAVLLLLAFIVRKVRRRKKQK